jgi:hypothetical protein
MKSILFLLAVTPLLATPIKLNSDLVNESNNRTAANVLINAHPLWQPNSADAQWISYGLTGNGQPLSPANVTGTITGSSAKAPTAIFWENFYLPYITNSGSITVWADDTARVSLIMPNQTVQMLFESNPVQGGACANGPIGCLPQNGQAINLTPYLTTSGNYQLQFDVYQRGGGPFGLLYKGSAESTAPPAITNAVPEPSTLLLGALGTVAMLVGFRRQAKRQSESAGKLP